MSARMYTFDWDSMYILVSCIFLWDSTYIFEIRCTHWNQIYIFVSGMYSSCVCGFTYSIYITHLFCVCILLLYVNLMYSMCEFFNSVFFCVRIWRIACVNSSIVCGFVWILLLYVNLLTYISFKCVLFFWVSIQCIDAGILLSCVNLLALKKRKKKRYISSEYSSSVWIWCTLRVFCFCVWICLPILLLCVNLLTYIRLWCISSRYCLFVRA